MLLKRFITTTHFFDKLIDAFLPPTCVLCFGKTETKRNLCLPCTQSLPILPDNCRQCGQFFAFSLAQENRLCGKCLREPPAFSQTFVLSPYEKPVSHLILGLKFAHKLAYAQTLSELMIEKIRNDWYREMPLPDYILPVPLHPRRLRERGFNQALEIAKPIARYLRIPIDHQNVQRTKYTLPQSELSAKKRRENVRNAFIVNRDFRGLTVAVVDDVITTGETLRALCMSLKKAGASRIEVWCCARR